MGNEVSKVLFYKKLLNKVYCIVYYSKKLGFNPEIHIGVYSNNKFSSHSWISVAGYTYLKDNNNFSGIYKIK